jgi:N-acetylmuramoyl-L-alanine amidase
VAPAGATVAVLRDVRPILQADTTRLVFEMSRRVPYTLRRLPGSAAAGTPPRLVLDLHQTRVDPALTLRLAPPGGPLVRLGASTLDGDVTRIVFDVPGLSEHHAFPLPDPFRLVVDVRGTPRPLAAAADSRPPTRAGGSPSSGAASEPNRDGGVRLASAADSAAVPAPPARRRWRIAVDPGHGGKDPGAIGVGGLREKDVVLAVARRLARRLREAGYEVILTRDGDVFLSLEERTARANAAAADLFLSVHANASANRSAAGVETYYLSNSNDRATIRLAAMENHLDRMTDRAPRSADVAWIVSDMIQSYKVEESVALARRIQSELVRTLGGRVRDLGAKPGPFYVLVGAGMPAILVETGFLTQAEEARRLDDPAHQEALAEGLLRAVGRFIENAEVASTL